jgi:hypothetical protein
MARKQLTEEQKVTTEFTALIEANEAFVMEQQVYVLVFRGSASRPWQVLGGPIRSRKLAEAAVEIQRDRKDDMEYAYIEGLVVIPAQVTA